METPAPFRSKLNRFSRTAYEAFLAKAKERGYSYVCFREFLPGAPPRPDRYIVLRHDIDFAPEFSLEMAEIEHAAGVRSTYFVLMDGQFYNPLRSEVIRLLRRIHALGHEIGLHFAVGTALESDIGQEIALRSDVLARVVGAPVRSFSQHDPVNAGVISVAVPPECPTSVDASQVIRDNHLLYVSDSAMMWRRHTFSSALDEDRNLCLLAHPHSWLHPQTDYVAMIRDLEALQLQTVTEPFDSFVSALSGYYARRLDEGI